MKKSIILLVVSVIMLSGCSEKINNIEKTQESNNDNNIQYIGEYSYYKNGVAYQVGTRPNNMEMFLDFDTMEKASLCAVPNCNHTVSSCLSKSIGKYKPVFYNDYVYFFSSNGGAVKETPNGSEFYINSSLKRVSLNSSEVETVCEFNDCVPSETGNYILYNNELYFIADDRGATHDDYGGYSWGNSGGTFFLCSINLDNNEYKNYGSIYDDDKKYESSQYSRSSNIRGIYNGIMYVSHSFVKDQSLDSSSDEYWTNLNFEFDFETRTLKEAELPFTRYMNEDCYIYQDSESKNMKIIYQEKESEFNLGFDSDDFRLSQCSEFNGKIFFPTAGKWFDLNDSSEHSMGEYAEFEVIGYYNGCYIFRKGSSAVKLTENELLTLTEED